MSLVSPWHPFGRVRKVGRDVRNRPLLACLLVVQSVSGTTLYSNKMDTVSKSAAA